MKKHIYEESNRLSYTMHGDYYLPDLVVNEEEPTYGKYGMLRKQFLKVHRPARYQYLLMTGELTGHLNQVDQEAREQVETLVKQMVEKQASEGIAADQLKQTILIYIPFAFMGLCAAAAMIVLLAYLNGRHMDMLAMFRRNRNAEVKRPRIISVPLVLALCVCIGFMIITEFVL